MYKSILKIIIIEDSIDDVELYSRILKKIWDARILHFSTAEDAIEPLKTEEYDLILLDYNLPKISGVDFLKHLIELEVNLRAPVIALTGIGNEKIAVEFMRLGVTDYLPKSDVNPDNLKKVVGNALTKFFHKKLESEKQEELALFAHTVAHDLKGPLGRITSYARLLSKKTEEKYSKYTTNIIDDASYMTDFLDHLMLYAETGRSNIDMYEVDIQDIIDQAIQNLEIQIKEKHAEIRYSALGNVIGSKIALIQLFQNLISNSIKYSLKEPRITITYQEEENGILISFTDNGIGIPPEMAEKALKPFNRIPNSLNEKGTGLGLALCDKIVKQHHGQITINTPEQGGTRFNISFPPLTQGQEKPAAIA